MHIKWRIIEPKVLYNQRRIREKDDKISKNNKIIKNGKGENEVTKRKRVVGTQPGELHIIAVNDKQMAKL